MIEMAIILEHPNMVTTRYMSKNPISLCQHVKVVLTEMLLLNMSGSLGWVKLTNISASPSLQFLLGESDKNSAKCPRYSTPRFQLVA